MKPFHIFEATILIGLLIMGITAIVIWDKETNECVVNPLVYGAQRLAEANEASISCSCSLSGERSGTLRFDNTSVVAQKNQDPFEINFDDIDFSQMSP